MKKALAVSNGRRAPLPTIADTHGSPDVSHNAALVIVGLESIQTMDEEKTKELKSLLHHGATVDIWETPPKWLPAGKARTLLPVDIRQRILSYLPAPLRAELSGRSTALLDRATLALTRYLILLRMAPSATGRAQGRPLKPSSVRAVAYTFGAQLYACALTALDAAMQSESNERPSLSDYDGALLICLNLKDMEGIARLARQHVFKECQRMHLLASMGFWSDVPALKTESRSDALLGAARSNRAPELRDAHLPLPDKYVAELASRCLWLINDLAPNLFSLGDGLRKVWEATSNNGWAWVSIRDTRREAVVEDLAHHVWKGSAGTSFLKPPFDVTLPAPKGFRKTEFDDEPGEVRWPPKNFSDFLCLISLVQSAHMCIVLLSLGGRQSEVLDLKRDCVVRAKDGRAYASGKTFKLVQSLEGEWRDWQLPEVAACAIEQQVRLAEMCEVLGSLQTEIPEPLFAEQHLWIRTGVNRGPKEAMKPLYDINRALTTLVARIGLDVNPGGQRLRSHRFRKTVARLVALALTQAPKILMDIFGHKSLEMTLYYILTDKDLRSEIETVTRELRVMRAKDVIEKMVEEDTATFKLDDAPLGGYGGLAAVSLSSAVKVHQERIHRRGDDWNADSVIELAELLTLQGQAWEQVRHGVLCTKLPGEAGPCNKKKGRPEPSKCSSRCGHRLEEEFLRNDVEGSIADSVAAYEQAIADAESLTAAHWAAQICAHVPRFPDLKAKWMANAVVQKVMRQSAETGVA